MQIFSIILMTSIFILLLKRRRLFAPEGIFFIGTAFYGLPLYYGHIQMVTSYSPLIYYSSEASALQYLIYNCNACFCGIMGCCSNSPLQIFYHRIKNYLKNIFRKLSRFEENKVIVDLKGFIERNMQTGLVLLNLVFLMLVVFYCQAYKYVGGSKLVFSKNLTSYYNWASLTTTYCFVYFVYSEKTKIEYIKIIPSILFLVIDLLMGYRLTTLLSLLSIFMVFSLKNKNIYRAKFFLFFTSIVSIMFIFKHIYFGGKLSQIFSSKIIIGSEPFTIAGTFEKTLQNITIVREHIQNDGYFTNSFLQLFPFYETLSGLRRVSFNKYIQLLFPETIWGLASNTYTELMVLGGGYAICIYLSIIFLLIVLYKNVKNIHFKLSFCVFLPYILFYGYRNDFLYPIHVIKHFIIVNFLCIVSLIICFLFSKTYQSQFIFKR